VLPAYQSRHCPSYARPVHPRRGLESCPIRFRIRASLTRPLRIPAVACPSCRGYDPSSSQDTPTSRWLPAYGRNACTQNNDSLVQSSYGFLQLVGFFLAHVLSRRLKLFQVRIVHQNLTAIAASDMVVVHIRTRPALERAYLDHFDWRAGVRRQVGNQYRYLASHESHQSWRHRRFIVPVIHVSHSGTQAVGPFPVDGYV